MKWDLKEYWNSDANSYNKSIQALIKSQRAKKAWQNLFTKVLGQKHLNILDVGTGPGIIAFLLSDLGHNVTAVDFSEGMLTNARNNALVYNLPVRFEKGDADNLPFPEGAFDAVVNRYVLWAITKPEKAISEWRRVLKPGGRVVIIDGDWYHNEKSLKRTLWGYLSKLLILITERRYERTCYQDEDVKKELWSVEAIRPKADIELLENAGFKNIQVIDKIDSKTQNLLEYLKNGYSGDTFLETAVK
ncbi:class I SAM-dependent methyltransferase [Methanothrix sp.]|uniref:class I SAM-dependent methyltransferase n=1 Tax=Methanothrix sp. TaxID=90426 RepID=UPI003BB50891